MNELMLNSKLINVNYENATRPTVCGRELHNALEVKSNYTTWFSRMCEYGFTEHVDYETCFPNLESETHGGQNKIDHQLSFDMAKEICMIQRTEIGRKFRQYFIEIEKAWNSPEMVMGRALQIAQKQIDSLKSENDSLKQEEIKLLEEVEQNKPKVLFADCVATSKTSILVGEMAKILKQNGVNIGQNRLFEWLRTNGYLIRRKSSDYNMPTQKSMELGLFEIKETIVTHADGHTSINKTPKVTGKGSIYFVNKFKSDICV